VRRVPGIMINVVYPDRNGMNISDCSRIPQCMVRSVSHKKKHSIGKALKKAGNYFGGIIPGSPELTERCNGSAVDVVEDWSKGGIDCSKATDYADVPGDYGKCRGTRCCTGGFKEEDECKRSEDYLECL